MTPKALREMCEEVIALTSAQHATSGEFINACVRIYANNAELIARALLDRLSGEAVTLDTIARTIWGHMFPEHPPEHWWKEDEYIRGKYLECAKVVSSLLPPGMDRNAIIEECSQTLQAEMERRAAIEYDLSCAGLDVAIDVIERMKSS